MIVGRGGGVTEGVVIGLEVTEIKDGYISSPTSSLIRPHREIRSNHFQ